MQISSTNNLFQALLNTRPAAESRINWQSGQIVQARVVSSVIDGLVQLRIGATLLTAQIDAEVKTGQKLTLEVVRTGEQPLLQPVSQDRLQQIIESAIRSVLPRQQSQAQLLSDLIALVKQKQLPVLPEKVQIAIKQLLQSIPAASSIRSADAVRNIISNSGIFLEAKLVQNNSVRGNFNSDLKVNLLRLQQVLQQYVALPGSSGRQASATTQTYTQTPPLTTTQTSNQTSPPLSSQSRFIFLRQNSSQPPTGTFLRTGVSLAVNTATATAGTAATITTNNTPAVTVNNTAITTTSNASITVSTPATTSTSPQTVGSLSSKPAIPATVVTVNGTPVNPRTSQIIPTTINHQQVMTTQAPGRETRLAPFYPTSMPFKVDMNFENTRPSARFSKLDNLTKILSFFLKDVDASLSRIQLNQLTPQQIESEQKPSWVFEIPIKNNNSIDLFQFKIEKEQQGHNETDNEKIGWTIQVSFNIEKLGQVYCTISIYQKKASITFWSEQTQTVDTFNQNMQQLQSQLEEGGLIVDQLNCIQGTPPTIFNQSIGKNILDEKA